MPVQVPAKILHKMAIDTVPEESDDQEEIEELEDGNVVGREDSENEDNMEEEGSDGNDSGTEDGESGQNGNQSADDATVIRNAMEKLQEGSLACLVTTDPMTSSPHLNHNTMAPIPPCHLDDALNIKPHTTNKQLLLLTL